MANRKRSAVGALATIAILCALAVAPEARGASTVGTGTHPWVVVLCNFSDQTATPHSKGYFEELFSDAGAGKLGELDYWHDVSFGQLSISGTTVTNWATAKDPETSEPLTRGEWIKLEKPFTKGGFGPAFRREDQILACADGASGITWSNYWGVVAIFPEARSTLAETISASATTAKLTTTENFPNGSAPFLMGIDEGGNAETVNVTAISGNEVTIERAQEGTTAREHAAGSNVGVPGDLGGVGAGQLGSIPIQGGSYTIATIILPHEIDVEGASHEMGHGHGYNHSRRLSLSTQDYNDCYDLMSVYSCDQAFSANPSSGNFAPGSGVDFGGSGLYGTVLGEAAGSKGPGLDAINLDAQGWIPGPRHDAFDNTVSKQETIRLHSLGDPNALTAPGSEYLEARVPAAVKIQNEAPGGVAPTAPPTCSGTEFSCTTSKYYSVEYREKAGWDRGFASSGVFLHLFGEDSRSYWVDQTPQGHGGLLTAADEYVDAANKAYVAVNAIDTGSHTAQVTLGSRKIEANLENLGPSSADFNDPVSLVADLKVSGSGAPVPEQPVVLSIGSQSCAGTTDSSGHASCSLTIGQHPGAYTLSASFSGDTAYASASASTSFTIEKEESQVDYSGALTSDYHDEFTASATLFDPDGGEPIAGKTINFTLGVGDSCSATTDAFGEASCGITPTQVPGPYKIEASFGLDEDYLSSNDTQPFEITKEETTTTYTGPMVILSGGSGVTLEGKLLEDGIVPIEGRTLTLSLGAQSCNGTTDAAGVASCTLIYSGPLGSQPLVAAFAGDAYYLPSEDNSKTAVVFAFPDHGAFALGDLTAGSAGPSTVTTWWGPDWASENSLSGGGAPSAFKGFVSDIALPTSTPPAACAGPWSSRPGNSSTPPASVPSFMGVIVSSSVGKSGSTISGNTTSIVVVATAPGYGPAPGHRGRGTIVATYC